MDSALIKQLLNRYYEGKTSLDEDELLFAYFNQSDVDSKLSSFKEQFRFFFLTRQQKASNSFKAQLAQRLLPNPRRFILERRLLKIAASIVLFIMGSLAGYTLNDTISKENHIENQLNSLTHELKQVKKTLTITLLSDAYAFQRINALNLATQLDSLDQELLSKILYVTNHDENINVQLMAVKTLSGYIYDPAVKASLLHVSKENHSSIILIELLRIMRILNEKTLIKELEKKLENSDSLKSI